MEQRARQSGYLLEVPIVMMAVGVLLALLLPKVPGTLGKLLLILGGLVWVGGFYYMIMAPGWRPGGARSSRPWAWVRFGLMATLIMVGITGYVVFG